MGLPSSAAIATATTSIGGADETVAPDRVREWIESRLAGEDLDGRSVVVIVPDHTRSCPLPLLLRTIHSALAGRVSRMSVLVALGTHAAMSPDHLATHLGAEPGAGGLRAAYPEVEILNHEWWEPATFADLGRIPAERVRELSGGRLDQDVPVRLNRAVVDHDVALVVGPVFPHEVVGFSGGNKYFFPGVGGQAVIDLSHWLGALITSAEIIGAGGTTPVRALIDEAAALIPARRLALSVVVRPSSPVRPGSGRASEDAGQTDLAFLAFGEPVPSWRSAAAVSAELHVRRLDEPVRRVVSVMPERYDDIWTAAKGFYKVEPVVADGGEVILYAPHITELSQTHPEIEEIGYHCRDFFLAHWSRFSTYHWGVLAHSTHLRGAGTYDAEHGERHRVRVVLATGIARSVVERAGLDYLDPADVDLAALTTDPETLVIPDAGEVLYRLADRTSLP